VSERTVIKFVDAEKTKDAKRRVPCLTVLEGSSVGKVFRIEKTSVLIGRSNDVDIVLAEEGVSRKHARIDTHEDSYSLTDLGSTNGTLVNGIAVEQVALHDGDKLMIGDVLLGFALQDAMDVEYQEKLRTMAQKDGLTNVFNRRYFIETLRRETNYALRMRQSLTCIMFDIDHFKKVNDQYGHQAGDTVLREIAKNLSEGLRAYDLLARYGGEEFIILLRGTALDNALIFAERIRKKAESLNIVFGGQHTSITISVGVSTLNPDYPMEAEDLIKEADRYLYEAKKRGRNMVCSVRNQGN